MDIASIPRNTRVDPIFRHLRVQCVCADHVINSPMQNFTDVPSQYGVEWADALAGRCDSLEDSTVARLLQHWLFFAFLKDISSCLGVDLVCSDFVDRSSGQSWMVGHALRKYAWFWLAATHATPSREQRTLLLGRLKPMIDHYHCAVTAWSGQDRGAITSGILLSSIVLGDTLLHCFSHVFEEGGILPRQRYVWNYPRLLLDRLLETGWCPAELPRLIARVPPSALLHLTSLKRRDTGKDHTSCVGTNCIANQLDEARYETAHAQGCDRRLCSMVHAPVSRIVDILESGGIPLLHVSTPGKQGTITIHAESFILGDTKHIPRYVAISHVWSDGMGNPKENALPACQLSSIQHYIEADNLLGCDTPPAIFWLDTLCVPLEPASRSLAVSRMAKTYLHAQKVLVLDNWLRYHTGEVNREDLLLKIVHSDWNSRLWTFQEGLLARERYFQVGDAGAVKVGLPLDLPDVSLNAEDISDLLGGMDIATIRDNLQALSLLRAIATVDEGGADMMSDYASLPPQADSEEEELRLIALEVKGVYERRRRLRARWLPVLLEGGCSSPGPEDFPLLLQIERDGCPIDTVTSYATLELYRLGGVTFGPLVNRTQDAEGGRRTRLTAFKDTTASLLLEDAIRGLPGRMTSKLEDETICLGGITGLDVTALLSIPAGKEVNPASTTDARQQRMVAFLSCMSKVPEGMLFWETNRLRARPWRWAPSSFLQDGVYVETFRSATASVTPNGLLYSGPSFEIHATKEWPCDGCASSHKTLHLEWSSPLSIYAQEPGHEWGDFYRSWQAIELRPSNASPSPDRSWSSYLSMSQGRLAVIVSKHLTRWEGVLVSFREQQDNLLVADYLANVVRPSSSTGQVAQGLSRTATWFDERPWCVG